MNSEIKSIIMREIENKAIRFKKISNVQYRIRCPFCGDSDKNPHDMHCYIKCDFSNPDEGIKYNCFLCNKGGNYIYNLLKALNADQKITDIARSSVVNTIGDIKESSISITASPDMNSPQVKFINERLGEGLTYEDFSKFRIIWNMNEIRRYISDKRKLNTLPNNFNRINFLSDNKSMILSRSFIEDSKESQWRKFPLFEDTGRSFYVIETTIDLFTSDIIILNIAEGILDILSAYKNFNYSNNSVYISSLGSNYISALQYMIMKGLIGKNIIVNIYIDHNIDEKRLFSDIKKYKWLFKTIKVYKNIKYKDIGINIEKIKLMEVKE